MKTFGLGYSRNVPLEDKLKYLIKNKISLDSVSNLYDFELEAYLNQDFTIISSDIKEKIMQLDINEDEKLEILKEFKNIKNIDSWKEFQTTTDIEETKYEIDLEINIVKNLISEKTKELEKINQMKQKGIISETTYSKLKDPIMKKIEKLRIWIEKMKQKE